MFTLKLFIIFIVALLVLPRRQLIQVSLFLLKAQKKIVETRNEVFSKKKQSDDDNDQHLGI